MKIKYIFAGMVMGVIFSAGYMILCIGCSDSREPQKPVKELSAGTETVGRADILSEAVLEGKAKADKDTLEKLRKMNAQIVRNLKGVESKYFPSLEKVLEHITPSNNELLINLLALTIENIEKKYHVFKLNNKNKVS